MEVDNEKLSRGPVLDTHIPLIILWRFRDGAEVWEQSTNCRDQPKAIVDTFVARSILDSTSDYYRFGTPTFIIRYLRGGMALPTGRSQLVAGSVRAWCVRPFPEKRDGRKRRRDSGDWVFDSPLSRLG